MGVPGGGEGVERRRQPGGVVELSAVRGDEVGEHAVSVLTGEAPRRYAVRCR
jgi:hypothetical protein